MKFQQREALRRAFEALPPENKRAFLRKLPRRRPTLWRMVCRQLRYIRLWTWAVSAAVFAATLLIGRSGEPMALWWCSALAPFLAMALVTELARSAACGMEELEMATRFSLRTVILSRLLLLGFGAADRPGASGGSGARSLRGPVAGGTGVLSARPAGEGVGSI